MPYLEKIKELSNLIMENRTESPIKHKDINTVDLLYGLVGKDNWDNKDFEMVDFLSKKMDISKKLFISYNSDGTRNTDETVKEKNVLDAAFFVFYKAIFLEIERNGYNGNALKRFNVFLKMMHSVETDWFTDKNRCKEEFDVQWEKLLNHLPDNSLNITVSEPSISFNGNEKHNSVDSLKEIPLTVMFYEGPNSRAYIETIRAMGLRPQKIIHLIAGKDVATRKPVGRWFPHGLRKAYASSIQMNKIHYWSRHIRKSHENLYNMITNEVEEKLKFPPSIVESANSLKDLTSYCPNVEQVLIDGLSDPKLHDYLSCEPPSAILFTGGGIVPQKLLEIGGLKYIHIHPGFLPFIRGADCALWSSMLTGHVSASCFYMSPGIDTGDIIKAFWLPPLALSSDKESDNIMKYRGIYSFLDPWVRAFVLREMLHENKSFLDIDSNPQSEDDGVTYHFMHSKLRDAAINRFVFNQK